MDSARVSSAERIEAAVSDETPACTCPLLPSARARPAGASGPLSSAWASVPITTPVESSRTAKVRACRTSLGRVMPAITAEPHVRSSTDNSDRHLATVTVPLCGIARSSSMARSGDATQARRPGRMASRAVRTTSSDEATAGVGAALTSPSATHTGWRCAPIVQVYERSEPQPLTSYPLAPSARTEMCCSGHLRSMAPRVAAARPSRSLSLARTVVPGAWALLAQPTAAPTVVNARRAVEPTTQTLLPNPSAQPARIRVATHRTMGVSISHPVEASRLEGRDRWACPDRQSGLACPKTSAKGAWLSGP